LSINLINIVELRQTSKMQILCENFGPWQSCPLPGGRWTMRVYGLSVIRHPVNFAAHHFSVSPIATSSQSVHNFMRCPDHKQTKWSHHPLSLSGLVDV